MIGLKRRLSAQLLRWAGYAPPEASKLEWAPAPSITSQSMTFRFRGSTLRIEADHTTPLYETIAELVDFDAYQLASVPWPTTGPVTLVDIGANIGVCAAMLATIPGAHVHCYEPLPTNAERLRANLQANGITQATCHEAAVTATDGTATFLPNPTVSVAGRVLETPAGDGSGIRVKTVSLATLFQTCGDVFLMKVDCEGGEYDLLEQLTPANAARVRHLTFEVHDLDKDRNADTLCRKLEAAGYSVSRKPDLYGRAYLHHVLASRKGASA